MLWKQRCVLFSKTQSCHLSLARGDMEGERNKKWWMENGSDEDALQIRNIRNDIICLVMNVLGCCPRDQFMDRWNIHHLFYSIITTFSTESVLSEHGIFVSSTPKEHNEDYRRPTKKGFILFNNCSTYLLVTGIIWQSLFKGRYMCAFYFVLFYFILSRDSDWAVPRCRACVWGSWGWTYWREEHEWHIWCWDGAAGWSLSGTASHSKMESKEVKMGRSQSSLNEFQLEPWDVSHDWLEAHHCEVL